ncbi:hypothetical protein D3C76_1739470 [compost metagenome]
MLGAPDQAAASFALVNLARRSRHIAPGPGQGRAEGIEDVSLGLLDQRRWQVFISRIGAKLRQSLQAAAHDR